MIGLKKGLVGRIMSKLEELQLPKVLFLHCIIHQQALCGKHLNIFCVLKPVVSVVNFIRGHALNHRQFQNFLKEVDSEYCDLPYHTAVRWLSCGKVLLRFYKLRTEIISFLAEKNRVEPLLSNPDWLAKLSFLVDITSYINELNLRLQGQGNLICDLYTIIKGFRMKLLLFEAQLETGNISHFQCLKEFCAETTEEVIFDFPKKIITDLKIQVLERFSDIDRIESDILLFQNPFGCEPAGMPLDLQLELIDLQANELLKEKHKEGQLVEFYRCLPDNVFPNLKKFASKMASMFGTTYICEQTFSKMKYVKSEHSTRLTDDHLKAILMVGCCTSKPNIDDIMTEKRQFHKSH